MTLLQAFFSLLFVGTAFLLYGCVWFMNNYNENISNPEDEKPQ